MSYLDPATLLLEFLTPLRSPGACNVQRAAKITWRMPTLRLMESMKLEQGQIWQRGEDYIRIVEWARLSIEYKVMKDPVSKVGTLHKATKKEFCRLLKGAVLLKPEDLPAAETEAAPSEVSLAPEIE